MEFRTNFELNYPDCGGGDFENKNSGAGVGTEDNQEKLYSFLLSLNLTKEAQFIKSLNKTEYLELLKKISTLVF